MAITDILGAAGGVIGGVGSLVSGIGGGKRLKKAYELQSQENRIQAEENYRYGEMAADNALQRQYELDESRNLVNQVKDVENAGLSYSVLGNGGGSQASGGGAPEGGGAKGLQPADIAALQGAQNEKRSVAIEGVMAAAESALKYAEAKKIKAETDKLNSDTEQSTDLHETNKAILEETLESIKGEHRVRNTNIAKATEETELIKIKRAGEGLQNKFQEIQNEIAERSKKWNIKSAKAEVEKLLEEIEYARHENKLSREQENDIIKALKVQIAATEIQTAATAQGIELTKAEITEIYNKIGLENERHVFGDGNIYNWKSWEGFAKRTEDQLKEWWNKGKETIKGQGKHKYKKLN